MRISDDIKSAVRDKLGAAEDNLRRARAAFCGLSDSQLDQQHGQSSYTRRELLEMYEADANRWKSTLGSLA